MICSCENKRVFFGKIYNSLRFILLGLFYLFFTELLYAQHFPMRHYTTYDGLSQMQVTYLYKDSRGYLWIGTKYGLNKFNGESFTSYQVEDGLPSRIIKSIGEDNKGYLWVLCEAFGLARFDGQRFQKYHHGRGDFSSLAIDAKGAVFCLKDHQLCHIVGDSLVTIALPNEWKNKPVESLFYEKKSESFLLWLRDVGLVRWKGDTWHLITPKPSYRTIQIQDHLLHQDYQTHHWFVEVEGSMQPFLELKGNIPKVLRALPFAWTFVVNEIPYILEKNSLIAQTIGENSELLGEGEAMTTQLPDENGVWIGGEKGLTFLATNGMRYFSQKEVPRAWGVVEDKEGNILIQNWLHPIQKWDGKTISTLHDYQYLIPVLKEESWYFKPQRDQLGHLWFSHTRGIMHYDGNKYQLLNYPTQTEDPLTFCLKEDPARHLMLQGAQGYLGMIENRPPYKRTVIPTTEYPEANILSIEIAADGTYWLAWGGLTHYNPDTKTIKNYARSKGNLPKMGAQTLHIDPKGTLWVGADLGGVYRYDAKKDQFVRFLPHFLTRPVNFIDKLDSDHLLIGDMSNLYVFDLKRYYATGQVRIKSFNHRNGFMGIEPFQNGSYHDSKGFVWVMSSTVLSRIDPRLLDLKTDSLRVFTTRLDTLNLPFVATDSIWTIPYGKNTVRVAFEAQ